jgi:hypothetical protein
MVVVSDAWALLLEKAALTSPTETTAATAKPRPARLWVCWVELRFIVCSSWGAIEIVVDAKVRRD